MKVINLLFLECLWSNDVRGRLLPIGQSIGQSQKSNFAISDKYRQNEVSNNGL